MDINDRKVLLSRVCAMKALIRQNRGMKSCIHGTNLSQFASPFPASKFGPLTVHNVAGICLPSFQYMNACCNGVSIIFMHSALALGHKGMQPVDENGVTHIA